MIRTGNAISGERTSIHAYCMLCRTGTEISVARKISQYYPELKAIAPVKTLQEKRQGHWELHEQILLPGYLFLYSEKELPFDLCPKVNNLYRVIQYGKGMRILTGDDEEYAQWIYHHQGRIGTSRVIMEEGSAIQVIDGPLLDCKGTIKKLDRHKRRAVVEFSFDGQKRIVSISAECVMPLENKDLK